MFSIKCMNYFTVPTATEINVDLFLLLVKNIYILYINVHRLAPAPNFGGVKVPRILLFVTIPRILNSTKV